MGLIHSEFPLFYRNAQEIGKTLVLGIHLLCFHSGERWRLEGALGKVYEEEEERMSKIGQNHE